MTTKSKMGEREAALETILCECMEVLIDDEEAYEWKLIPDGIKRLREQLSNALQDAANISVKYGQLSEKMGELRAWEKEARLTLQHLSATLQKLGVPYRVDWREWISQLEAKQQQSELDARRYRWLRAKSLEKEGPGEDYYTRKDRWSVSIENGGMGHSYRMEALDAQIDTALSSGQRQDAQQTEKERGK